MRRAFCLSSTQHGEPVPPNGAENLQIFLFQDEKSILDTQRDKQNVKKKEFTLNLQRVVDWHLCWAMG